ncbi:MAG: Ig-like domain-containing protein, partial [Rufibacter sp.]
MQKQVQKVSLLLVALFWLTSIGTGMAQIHLAGGTYQENFDGMGASGTVLPNGWAAVRLAGDGLANERLAPIVTEGSAFSGGIYNVGATGATERALGTLASSTTTPAFGVSLKNTTAGDITKLEISAIMEQWRSGSRNDRLETIIFEYSTDATSLITGTWTAASSLDLVEKLTATTLAEAVNGNEAAHQTQIGGTLAVNIPAGGTIWLRWKDADVTGSDGLYAIDNFQVTPTYTVVDNVAPQLVSGNPDNGATNVPTQLDFVLTFNEPIIAGTGQVTLNWSGGSISRSTSDPEVIYSDNT